jgi:hypothetical protein
LGLVQNIGQVSGKSGAGQLPARALSELLGLNSIFSVKIQYDTIPGEKRGGERQQPFAAHPFTKVDS